MNALYPATLRHSKGLVVCFLLGAGLVVIVPALTGAYYFAAFHSAFFAFIVWRFRQMSLCFTGENLIYRGWFSRHEIPYAAIESVFRPGKAGWPNDRFYDASVFEIVSRAGHARINLLWFGPAGSPAFKERVLQRSRSYES